MHARSTRLMHLRRPPILVAAEGRFVPVSATIDEVDRAWAHACERNPRLFDGPLWHVAGVSRNGHGGVTLHVIESSYRFHAVRREGLETGIRPLGVKGLTRRGERLLLGRRSAGVHAEGGLWEFVPGGTLEPGRAPAEAIAHELHEEAGWRCVRAPVAIALLLDDRMMTWEIVHLVDGEPEPSGARPRSSCWEVAELLEATSDEIATRPLSRSAALLLQMAQRLLTLKDGEQSMRTRRPSDDPGAQA